MKSLKILKTGVDWKDFAPAFVIVFNSLVWYTLTFAVFSSTVANLALSSLEILVVFILYYSAVLCSALLGAVFFSHARENRLLLWMLVGTVISGLSATIAYNNILISAVLAILLGISTGTGLPSCLAYFADATLVENRGLYGGITWSAIGFGNLILIVILGPLNLTSTFAVLAAWRMGGLVAFFFLSRRSGRIQQSRSSPDYGSILRRKDVVLYLIPWIMFCLVNFVETPILERLLGDFFTFASFVEFAITGFSAIIGGLLSDLVGRKRVVITGFVMIGIGYAVLSLFSEMLFSMYLYTVLDGLAWGFFASVFFMTIWGDLAEDHQKEKYYALGGLPYLLATFLPILIRPYVGMIGTIASFSLASFFLFLAVLPLMFAPETLPEKRLKDRELKGYVEKAKKTKEKYT